MADTARYRYYPSALPATAEQRHGSDSTAPRFLESPQDFAAVGASQRQFSCQFIKML